MVKKEKRILESFFTGKSFDIPNIPTWVTSELIQHWNENMFHVHFVPQLSLEESLEMVEGSDRPSKSIYKMIKNGTLSNEAIELSGKWLLIDGRDKPSKKVPWVNASNTLLLQKMGFNPKGYFKKWSKQSHERDYLKQKLSEDGFGSRYCLNIDEVRKHNAFTLDFLKIDSQKVIRQPFFSEYNYFGNAIYKQWKTTGTWEWFEDVLSDGQHLAGGCKDISSAGWDPPEYWSTILSFRYVIEL